MAKIKNTNKYSFYDVKSKKKFVPEEYEVKVRSNRRFAVAKNPATGIECWRILGANK